MPHGLVSLALVARTSEICAPAEYVRIDRRPCVVIAAIPDDASHGEAMGCFEEETTEIVPDEGDFGDARAHTRGSRRPWQGPAGFPARARTSI